MRLSVDQKLNKYWTHSTFQQETVSLSQ